MRIGQGYYPQLTGVRALAAYMVFMHHYPIHFFGNFIYTMTKEMYVGVPIFFVLSGFLIYFRYSEISSLRKDFLLGYFKNRFAKIYPSYFFIVLVGSLIDGSLLYFLLQVTFVRGFSDVYRFIGVAQGWSLTVEECFYFLFPVLLIFIRRLGFLIPLLGLYLTGFIFLTIGTAVNFHGFFTPANFVLGYTIFGNASFFFIGMYLAKVVMKRNSQAEIQPKSFIPIYTLLGTVGITACVYALSKLVTPVYMYGGMNPIGRVILLLISPCFIALLFYGLVTEKSFIRNVFQSRLVVLLGKSSYIFYLIHLGYVYQFLTTHISHNKLILFVLLNIIAIVLYYTMEKPCQKLIKNFRWNRMSALASPSN